MCRIGRDRGRGVVGPLREARRNLKPLLSDSGTGADTAALREEVARLELAAEKAMQAELEKLAAARVSRADVAPVAISDMVRIEQGATTMPSVLNEPDEIAAPTSVSW